MSTFGSLFAGVGGFDLGFEVAGWECRWQVEWDARCRSVLARRWPEVERFGDVRDVDAGVLRPVDCITYGFPCQDLSVAGQQAGLDGKRSGLFFEATRIIREMREATDGTYPRVAVAENVPGLLSADGGAAMGRCLDEVADCGAVGIEWAVLDAQHFGVPQRRRRVFIVAWFDSRIECPDPLLPVASRCQGHPDPGGATGTEVAAPALTGNSVAATRNNGGHLIPAVKAKRAQTDTDYESWVEGAVAPTLNAFDNNSESRATVLTPESLGVRRLTPRECERLMGWPDDHTRWDAEGKELSDSWRYRACGNGVVAPVAEWIGKRLNAALGEDTR